MLKGGWGGLEPESPKACVPRTAKSIFPFVEFHYEIRVRGGGDCKPPPPHLRRRWTQERQTLMGGAGAGLTRAMSLTLGDGACVKLRLRALDFGVPAGVGVEKGPRQVVIKSDPQATQGRYVVAGPVQPPRSSSGRMTVKAGRLARRANNVRTAPRSCCTPRTQNVVPPVPQTCVGIRCAVNAERREV